MSFRPCNQGGLRKKKSSQKSKGKHTRKDPTGHEERGLKRINPQGQSFHIFNSREIRSIVSAAALTTIVTVCASVAAFAIPGVVRVLGEDFLKSERMKTCEHVSVLREKSHKHWKIFMKF